MSKLSVAVCDENQSYGKGLSTWLFVEQGKEFSGGFFSSVEALKEQYDKQRFQIILLGRDFLQKEWIQKEIRGRRDILWVYLQEEGEEGVEELKELVPAVEKYQPIPGMVRYIYRYYQEYQMEETELPVEKARLLGWYSPEQSIWQTPLALTMAALLAEKEKALYVNLKECSGMRQWFQEEYEQDLLEVMYCCHSPEPGSAANLGSFVYSMEQLDYLPPVRDGVLLGQLTEEDYCGFLEMLKRTEYDVVVLDMGSMFPGFFRAWNQCSRVYIPQERNVLARGIDAEFEEMVKRQEDSGLEEKAVWLNLPEWSRENLMPGCLVQQWLWGGQGDYVRELLAGRSREN